MEKRILAAGGGARLSYAAQALSQVDGIQAEVVTQSAPLPSGCDVLLLPILKQGEETIPGCKNLTLAQLLTAAKPQIVLAGKLPSELAQALEDQGIWAADYLNRESFSRRNAVPTAEGAIQLAMEQLPVTIWGVKAAVLGFGRIGMALAPRLQALGADVTVCARHSESRALAQLHSLKTASMDELEKTLSPCRLIVNTVPAKVLVENVLKALSPDVCILDLASVPGGVDEAAAKRLGLNVLWALSLPTKVAPKTAGEILADTVLEVLESV